MGLVVGAIIEVTVSLSAAAAEAAASAASAAIAEGIEVAAEAIEGETLELAAETAAENEAAGASTFVEGIINEGAFMSTEMLQVITKLSKFIKEFFAIDAVFKVANGTIHALEGLSPRYIRLKKNIEVLDEMQKLMITLKSWLEDHSNDYVNLDGFSVPVDSGLLAEAMKPLIAGIGNLKRLATDVERNNKEKKPITDSRIGALRSGLVKVNTTFESLATFIDEKKTKFSVLASFPISRDKVDSWKVILRN